MPKYKWVGAIGVGMARKTADGKRNYDGITVNKGVGLLETDKECRQYLRAHLHKGDVMKIRGRGLPDGRNY
jgi:hypothetical protein